MTDGASLALAWPVLLAASTFQGAVGFGMALLSAPLLLLIAPGLVPAPLIANASVLTALILWRERDAVELGSVGWAIAGSVGGALLAAHTLAGLSPRGFELLFGILILLAVGLSAGRAELRVTAPRAAAAGALAGFMGTLSSVGGPPVALLYQSRRGAALRATLSAYFLVASLIGLGALASVGRLGRGELSAAAALLPATLAGFALSGRAAPLLDRHSPRPWVLGLSALGALVVLGRALFGGS